MTRVICMGGSKELQNKPALTFTVIATIAMLLTLTTVPADGANINSVEITNLTGETFNLSESQILAMPKTYTYGELYCYSDLITAGNWSGIKVSSLISQADLTWETESLELTASDGYKVSIPVALAMQLETIIAYEKDDQPLSEGLRLILPGFNGAIWIAEIETIKMSSSVVSYPEAVGDGDAMAKFLREKFNLTPTVSISPTPTQLQPTTNAIPTSNPTPTSTPTTTPTTNPTAAPQTTDNSILLYSAMGVTAVLATMGAVVFMLKKRL